MRPFRFGLHVWELPVTGWRERVRRYESLGFSTITFTDHLVVPQWDPLAGLAAIAAVTKQLRVGTLVLDMALRNPVLTAKWAATVDRLSGGRLELGLGAGYVVANFAAAGVAYEAPGNRVARLTEATALMRRLWSDESTTMHGRFYEITDCPRVAPEPVRPTLLVGGGGRSMMRLAGRVADVASMIPRQRSGQWSLSESLADSTLARMAQKAAWVREGAAAVGRASESVELAAMAAKVIVGDRPEEAIAKEAASVGVTPQQLKASTLYLCGTGADVRQQLQLWRERAGISYVSLFDPGEEQIEYLAAEVLAPLSAGSPSLPSSGGRRGT